MLNYIFFFEFWRLLAPFFATPCLIFISVSLILRMGCLISTIRSAFNHSGSDEERLHLSSIPADVIRTIVPLVNATSLKHVRLVSPNSIILCSFLKFQISHAWNTWVLDTYKTKIDNIRFHFSFRPVSFLRSIKFSEASSNNYWIIQNEVCY